MLDGYRQMSAVLAASKFSVKAASMTARHSWQLVTGDDVRIELGRSDNMKRLKRFIELWPVIQQQATADNKRVSYVDLRYDSGAAVGWAPAFIEPQDSNQQQNQAQAKQQ